MDFSKLPCEIYLLGARFVRSFSHAAHYRYVVLCHGKLLSIIKLRISLRTSFWTLGFHFGTRIAWYSTSSSFSNDVDYPCFFSEWQVPSSYDLVIAEHPPMQMRLEIDSYLCRFNHSYGFLLQDLQRCLVAPNKIVTPTLQALEVLHGDICSERLERI